MSSAKTRAALAEALALHERGNLIAAEAAYRNVLDRDPREPQALQYLGVLLAQTGRGEAGIELMTRAVGAAPRDIDARLNLAHALATAGRPADAIAQLRHVVAQEPRLVPAWQQLGALQFGEKRFDDAAASFAKAAELAPRDAPARYNGALALQSGRRLREAAAQYRLAIAIDPNYADAHNNLGNTLSELGDLDDSVAAYRRALALRPVATGTRINLAAVLHRMRKFDEAAAEYEAVLAVQPDHRDALLGAGAALLETGESTRAAHCYERLLAREPAHFAALIGLGRANFGLKRFDLALPAFERALAVDPASPDANCHYATALLMERGDIDRALPLYRKALELQPNFSGARNSWLFALHYDPAVTPAEMRAAHDTFEAVHGAPLRAQWRRHDNSRDAERRLRIGYVSPDFRNHSCAYFVEPLLAAHDRAAVEVFCYANVSRPDATTARLKAYDVSWRSIHGMKDEAAADLVRGDGIDILVDLAGHTADNRLLLFAHKPAPVQVTWLGYPDTAGLAAIDYRLTDAIADPPGLADAFARETLLRLDGGFLCYRPSADAPPVAPLPALSEGRITLGSFNNLAKLNDATIALWARVLDAVPGARLAIKDSRLHDRTLGAALVGKFMARGIAQERIVTFRSTRIPITARPRPARRCGWACRSSHWRANDTRVESAPVCSIGSVATNGPQATPRNL
jgi:predicted O-linked N-acetylglucosamine transferase (SPINDLY family)